jgi:recombinational DNA repair protein RecR
VKTLRQSEENNLEQSLVDNQLAAVDLANTQEELMKQIMQESYLEWICNTQQTMNGNSTVNYSTTLMLTC